MTKGKTTLTIAHRVKTIMNADCINVLEARVIKERGRFSEIERFKNTVIDLKEEEESLKKSDNELLKKMSEKLDIKKKDSMNFTTIATLQTLFAEE